MRAVIIGAGRGSRLQHRTDDIPKTMVEVMGRPMLDHILAALGEAGIASRDVVFISGYAEHVVRERHPEFTFVRNDDWQNNNILHSLLMAREHLEGGVIVTYADIVYEGAIVRALRDAPEDIVLGCDVAWRRRYVDRHQHPETDAEKLRAEGRRVVELSRHIDGDATSGEFIGVMKVTAAGARTLLRGFDRVAARFADDPTREYREGRSFRKAYLIDLLQELLESGIAMYREDTQGGYMELDTLEDLDHAEQWWHTRPSAGGG